MTGEWGWRQQLYYINMKLSMERGDAMMSLLRRTWKSIYTFNADKKKKEKEMWDAFCLLLFCSHFPVYITQTYTWRIQSHTPKNSIVRNDIISNELSSATARSLSLSYKLILLNRHANTSQEERLGPSRFHSLIIYIYVYIKVKWAVVLSYSLFVLIEYLQFKNISWYSRRDCL